MYFAGIRLGSDHLTGPTGDSETFQNTFAEHATARGKPPLQVVGSERDKRELDFYFDETWCDPEAEWARLYGHFLSKTPGALIIPGVAWRGTRYVVDTLSNKKEATTANGRIVRISASMSLSEDPRVSFSGALSGIYAGAIGEVQRAARSIDLRR